MLNKSLLAILVLVIVVVIGAGIYAGSTQVNPTSQSNDIGITTITANDNIVQNNDTQNNSGKTMINATEAQNIAKNFIEEENATAGTPHLVEIDGQMIYVVPVIMNDNTVGQIEIDAYTGNNVGGAGGVA